MWCWWQWWLDIYSICITYFRTKARRVEMKYEDWISVWFLYFFTEKKFKMPYNYYEISNNKLNKICTKINSLLSVWHSMVNSYHYQIPFFIPSCYLFWSFLSYYWNNFHQCHFLFTVINVHRRPYILYYSYYL